MRAQCITYNNILAYPGHPYFNIESYIKLHMHDTHDQLAYSYQVLAYSFKLSDHDNVQCTYFWYEILCIIMQHSMLTQSR